MKNEKIMRKAFADAAYEMLYVSDPEIMEAVIENTMESRIGKVCGKDEIKAFVKAELAKMNDATSDYSFQWSFNN